MAKPKPKPKQKPKLGEFTLTDCGGSNSRQRVLSRSVSWSSNGSWLAWAASDRLGKIWTIENSSAREVVALSGHSAAVDRIRFHPEEANVLCTAAQDHTIRIWDIRSGSQRSLGLIPLLSSKRYGSCPASLEWSSGDVGGVGSGGSGGLFLAVTERDDNIHIYDVRKLNSGGAVAWGRSSSATPLRTFSMQPHIVEGCRFSPNGKYLVSTITTKGGEGMGEVRVFPFRDGDDHTENYFSYPGHTGPIYHFCFSPDESRLVTAGGDAIVGIWDTKTMVCTHTISRRSKFIRCVSVSHDSRLLASSSEDDGIDLADLNDGSWVSTVFLSQNSRRGGADEVAFHPKAHLLACARGDFMGTSQAPVVVAKLSVTG